MERCRTGTSTGAEVEGLLATLQIELALFVSIKGFLLVHRLEESAVYEGRLASGSSSVLP